MLFFRMLAACIAAWQCRDRVRNQYGTEVRLGPTRYQIGVIAASVASYAGEETVRLESPAPLQLRNRAMATRVIRRRISRLLLLLLSARGVAQDAPAPAWTWNSAAGG